MSTPDVTVRELVGQRCWYISAGGVTAPSFVVVMGNRVTRERPLANKHHPQEFRENRGSVELLVWCSWRLQRGREVLASSDQGQFGLATVKGIVGAVVDEATCIPPAWDLTVRLSNGLELQVFCDHVEPNASASQNWELWYPGGYACAGPGGEWTEEAP